MLSSFNFYREFMMNKLKYVLLFLCSAGAFASQIAVCSKAPEKTYSCCNRTIWTDGAVGIWSAQQNGWVEGDNTCPGDIDSINGDPGKWAKWSINKLCTKNLGAMDKSGLNKLGDSLTSVCKNANTDSIPLTDQ